MKLAYLCCLALLLASPAFADDAPVCPGRDLSQDSSIKPDFAAHADDAINEDGLLWKIEKGGLAPSYLYGTVHSTNAAALALAEEAAKHIDGATSVATELGGPFDTAQQLDIGAGMLKAALSPDEDTFAKSFSKSDAEAIDAFLTARGFSAAMTHHLKLWFVAVSVGFPRCEVEGQRLGLKEVDQTIAQIGKDHGLAVVALETVDEQLKTLASVPDALAATMLLATASAPGLNDDGYATLLSLYLQKRPAAAIAVLDAIPGLTKEQLDAEAEFTRLLLVGRNETMLTRATPLLEKGGTFIAVGALHLPGKNGLIERARAAGYTVTKVW